MDNFETQGGVNPSSIPTNSDSSSMGGVNVPQSNVGDTSKMTWLGYLKDGVDKGYYKVDNEPVFSMEEVIISAENEMQSEDEAPDKKIMNIPGTAHDKLAGIGDIEDEKVDEKPEIIKEEEMEPEDEKRNNSAFEQRVITLQSEALKYFAKAMSEKKNDKEKEELLKKLQGLMEELDQSESSNKDSLITAVLRVILMLFNSVENGTKNLEKEVKRSS